MLGVSVAFWLCLLAVAPLVSASEVVTCSGIVPMKNRADVVSIVDFGGVGDGRTLNTVAFRKAIKRIEKMKSRGGTQLYIPSGVWLTGCFNLTSHMTLFLAKDAVIRATQVTILPLLSSHGFPFI